VIHRQFIDIGHRKAQMNLADLADNGVTI
jgi:hypothetical protein